MKIIGYKTGRLYLASLLIFTFIFFTLLDQFKKTRGVSIKNIKDKSNLCDLNIVLELSKAFV